MTERVYWRDSLFTVDSNVLIVSLAKLLNVLVNHLDPTGLTSRFGRVVGVCTGAVPVSLQRLGVEGDLDPPFLSDTV